jgi:hypothetical protein
VRARAAALALTLLALPDRADVLVLADGRIFEGVTLEPVEGAVLVRFENGELSIPEDRILECVYEDPTRYRPRDDEERARLEEGLVRLGERWVRPAVRERELEKRIEERKAWVASVQEQRLWRNRLIEDSRTFHYECTVPPHLFESYRDRMEAYYALFAKRWKIRKPRDLDKLVVRFYAEPDDFYQITGVSRGVLAFFSFAQPPFDLHFYYDRLDPFGTERDMFHEFGHYLHKLIDVEFRYSHWPGESLAEYFSTATWDEEKGELTSEPQVLEDRLISIQRDIEEGDRVGLEELILEANRGHYHDYTWGWSLVYFLMNEPQTAKRFEDFFLGLARDRAVQRQQVTLAGSLRWAQVEGDEMLRYFRKKMGLKRDEDVLDLEARWHDQVEHELTVTSSRGLARAARMAERHGRKQRARRLYGEATEQPGADALTHHRFAELLADLDEHGEARVHWARATELDPLVGEYWIAWGRSLLREDATKEEGKRLLRLAHELEPENRYLEENLARLLKN